MTAREFYAGFRAVFPRQWTYDGTCGPWDDGYARLMLEVVDLLIAKLESSSEVQAFSRFVARGIEEADPELLQGICSGLIPHLQMSIGFRFQDPAAYAEKKALIYPFLCSDAQREWDHWESA